MLSLPVCLNPSGKVFTVKWSNPKLTHNLQEVLTNQNALIFLPIFSIIFPDKVLGSK